MPLIVHQPVKVTITITADDGVSALSPTPASVAVEYGPSGGTPTTKTWPHDPEVTNPSSTTWALTFIPTQPGRWDVSADALDAQGAYQGSGTTYAVIGGHPFA
jgi:hypothetical protein